MNIYYYYDVDNREKALLAEYFNEKRAVIVRDEWCTIKYFKAHPCHGPHVKVLSVVNSQNTNYNCSFTLLVPDKIKGPPSLGLEASQKGLSTCYP